MTPQHRRRHSRAHDDVGSMSTSIAVLVLGMLMAVGLVLDGGAKTTALAAARDIADNAARAGAQAVDLDALRSEATPQMDPGAAVAAANAYLAATGSTGTVTVAGETVTVTVTMTVPRRVLPGSPWTVTATETAVALAQIE